MDLRLTVILICLMLVMTSTKGREGFGIDRDPFDSFAGAGWVNSGEDVAMSRFNPLTLPLGPGPGRDGTGAKFVRAEP